jgi:uncharacterized protein YdaU (DUF1376 family)
MMHYWRKGPLPDDLPALVMMGRLASSNASSIAQALLGEFFTKNGDGHWHQKRQDAEREKWQKKKVSAVEKAKKAAEGRWGDAPSNASSTPQAMLQPCPLPLPLPLPLPIPLTKEQKPSSKPRKGTPEPTSQQRVLYRAYPRHVAPQDAYRAIEKALRVKAFDQLLLAVQNFAKKCARDGLEEKYIAHPATWFNRGSYDDEEFQPGYKVKPNGGSNGNGLTKGERLKQAAAEAIAELEHDYAVANGTGDAEAGESR